MAEAQNSNDEADEGDTPRLGLYKIKVQRRCRLEHSEDAYGVVDEVIMDVGELVAVKEVERPNQGEDWLD